MLGSCLQGVKKGLACALTGRKIFFCFTLKLVVLVGVVCLAHGLKCFLTASGALLSRTLQFA